MQINNLAEILDIRSLEKIKPKSTVKTDLKNSFKDSLEKAIDEKKVMKNIKQNQKKSASEELDNEKVFLFDINTISVDGLKLLNRIDKVLSSNLSEEKISGFIQDLNKVLGEGTEVDLDESMEEITNILDSLEHDESLEFLEETKNFNASYLSNLNNENKTSIYRDVSSETDLEHWINSLEESTDFSDLDSSNLLESFEKTLDSISEKLDSESSILDLEQNSESNDISNFSKKLTDLIVDATSNSKNIEDNEIKKEDIQLNINNLNISQQITSPVMNKSLAPNNASLHPIIQQVLENINAQLSTLQLDKKTIELRLRLYPSKLGSISVLIEKEDSYLKIKLLSDNAKIRDVLAESINDLKFELDKSKETTVYVDVSSDNQGNRKEYKNNANSEIAYKNIDSYEEDASIRTQQEYDLKDKIIDITI